MNKDPNQQLAVGSDFGPYKIVRLLGKGGMGEVYEAFEERLQRRVALKIVGNRGSDQSAESVRRFLQEAKTQAKINNPHVVTVYSIEKIDNLNCIAMEFVEGITFNQVLSSFVFSIAEAIPLCMQMLEGLKALHEKGVLHRDLKPHNMIIQSNGHLKILDLGIAKIIGDGDSEHTATGTFVGTASYVAPEIACGLPASMQSDLWSLGAIFYECVVGQKLVPPAAGNNILKTLETVKNLEVTFPTHSNRWIPPEFQAIIRALCAKDPRQRFRSAHHVLLELKKLEALYPNPDESFYAILSKEITNTSDVTSNLKNKGYSSTQIKKILKLSVIKQEELNANNDRTIGLEDSRKVNLSDEAISASISALSQDRLPTTTASLTNNRLKATNRRPTVALVMAMFALVAFLFTKYYGIQNLRMIGPDRTIELSEPQDRQVLNFDPANPVRFGWLNPRKKLDFEVQIASDRQFNTPVIPESVPDGLSGSKVILMEGHYFWRVHSKTGSSVSAIRELIIKDPRPLEALAPDDHAKFVLNGTTTTNVDFIWSCRKNVSQYRLQVATDADFSRMNFEKVVPDCAFKSVPVGAGNLYWRVQSELPEHGLWSSTRTLTVEPGVAVVQPAAAMPALKKEVASSPISEAPHPRPKVSELDLSGPKLKNDFIKVKLQFAARPGRDVASVKATNPPLLEWQAGSKTKFYFLQISESSNFIHSIVEENIQGEKFLWADVLPGTYYWRVRGVSQTGTPSNFSAAGKINVQLPHPQMAKSYRIEKKVDVRTMGEEVSLDIEFSGVPLAKKYKGQIGRDRTFASVQEFRSDSDHATIRLTEPATYFVRVAAASSDNELVSGYSDAAPLEFVKLLKLDQPEATYPPDGAKILGSQGADGVPVVFLWKKINHADGYMIEIAKDPKFQNKIVQQSLKSTRWVYRSSGESGTYYWHVRATSSKGLSEWTDAMQFDIGN